MENQIFTNRTKASSRPLGSVGTYLGKVVRIADNGDLFVKIPNLSTNSVFGPCKNFAGHAPVDIYVIVSFLDSRLDEPVVTGVETSVRYKVGDTGPGGGIIFYVDRFNEYSEFTYLELSPSYEHIQRAWATNVNSNQTTATAGGESRALGAGYQNTLNIVAQTGNVAATCAAAYCADLVSGGQSDWYLPSVAEIKMVHNVAYHNLGISGFGLGTYWSSTESTASTAWGQYFDGRTHNVSTSKSTANQVAPVRRFE